MGNKVINHIQNNFLIFDGAMGTMLQKRGLVVGDLPERFNLTNKEIVKGIHKEYVEAGCHVITTNTFQANSFKIKDDLEDIIVSGITLAKQSGAKFVAQDIGPLGKLLEPMGSLTFDEAYDSFKEQAIIGEAAGADLILLETFSDIYEAKAAILAIKENTALPVFVSLSFQSDGRTFVGVDPVTATVTLQGLGVDALGVNCSLGPDALLPIVEKILKYSTVPVLVQPNAGLPNIDGEYDFSENEFGKNIEIMADMGGRIFGGCCGTTPEFTKEIVKVLRDKKIVKKAISPVTAITSGVKTVVIGEDVCIIGERINPTGKKLLKQALKEKDYDYILNEAITQENCGASVLDVNVGLPELDEPVVLKSVIKQVQSCVNLPLQIDSSSPEAIEAGVRYYNGKPIINSVNGKMESMEAIFPIAKKYGGVVLGLCLDEKGIPQTARGRADIAKRIVETGKLFGIDKKDIIIDCLVLTASAQQDQVMTTIEAIKLVKEELGCKCVLGVSNVSFGLPSRDLINANFLTLALGAGLDAPIMNPMAKQSMDAIDSFRVLKNWDINSEKFISRHGNTTGNKPIDTKTNLDSIDLKEIIITGRKNLAKAAVEELLKTLTPIEIIDNYFVVALDIVGQKYETGEIFLPQLMESAKTVQNAFGALKLEGNSQKKQEKIVLATVKGDIHDIGKNIVKMLLENYGYKIIDLGKDVPIEEVVKAIREQDVKLVGLSALMTTTVENMKKTIQAIRDANLDCKVIVGGAVLNEEYSKMVGADYYARDARVAVSIANDFFEQQV